MDYHADRFPDFSLIVSENDKWLAVLPANREGDKLFSHRGLTYGGLVYGAIRLETVLAAFEAILVFLKGEGIERLVVKTIPYIYHERPSQETDYALALTGAGLWRRDTLSVLDLSAPLHLSADRKAGIRRGEKASLTVRRETDPGIFWERLLVPTLEKRHQAAPVHSVSEMRLLMERFPENIQLYVAYDGVTPVAGTVLYVSGQVVHSQYIASDDARNRNGSLDFLHDYLLRHFAGKKRWFDFGISNESDGKRLNGGLSYWKESFGCGTVVHDFYEVDTANHPLLQNVLL